MKKRIFAALMCLIMVLTLMPVTAFAADGPKTYTFTSTQIFDETDLRANVYFKGDTIVFTPDAIEPFTSSDYGQCKMPNVGLKIGGGTDVTGGICSVNTYSSDGSGYMVSFTITSDNPVTLDYKGAGPTGIETSHDNPGDNWYQYRYQELQFVAHPTNYAVDYDLGTDGSWQIGTNQPTSFVLDGNKGTYSLQIPTPQSNDSNYYFSHWFVSENARILGISNLVASGYAQTAYPVNGETVITLFIGFKGTGERTGTEGFTLEAIWSSMPRAAAPTFSIDGGNYTSTQMVSLSCTTPNATIYYTTDGSVPSDVTSTEYTTPIEVSSTTTIAAKAYPPASVSMNSSEAVSETYTIGTPTVETVATPTFSPAGGTYTSTQSVTLSCTTSGATIRYTDDGSDPTESSTLYNGAISVSSTTTLKAKAFKSGMTASETASAIYTISVAPPPVQTVAKPTFSPTGGTYTSAKSVTISCTTPGATIRYTDDGSEPTESSTLYNGAISVSSTTTLKAKAFKSGMTASQTASATYTISVAPPPAPPTSGGDYTPSPVTVYNAPSVPDATVRLTGSGLSSSDLLITERNPQGSAYKALLKLADSDDVFSTYNIHLLSDIKSTGYAMNLTFDLNVQYAGQDFTLVHQKADGTYEYFYDTADANGDLTFGPLYELSPFMLVKGTLTSASMANVVDIPKTGDNAQLGLWAGIVLISLFGLGAVAYSIKRKRA